MKPHVNLWDLLCAFVVVSAGAMGWLLAQEHTATTPITALRLTADQQLYTKGMQDLFPTGFSCGLAADDVPPGGVNIQADAMPLASGDRAVQLPQPRLASK